MPSDEPPPLPMAESDSSSPPVDGRGPAERLLRQMAVITAVLVVIWTLAVISFTGSKGTVAYGIVATFGLTYPIHLIIAGVAIWNRVKRHAPLRFTVAIIAAPWVLLPLPFLLKAVHGGRPLLNSPGSLIHTALAALCLAVALVLIRPRQTAELIPRCMLRSRTFNFLILLGMIILYLLPVGYLAYHATELQASWSRNHEGYLLAYGLGGLTAYLMLCTFPAGLICGYSGLTLNQSQFTSTRKWRLAQLVAALPLTLIGSGLLARAWWASL